MTSTSHHDAHARPRVLLIGLLAGIGGMHLPRHLARAGLDVDFCGVRTSFASASAHVRAFYPWHADGGFAVTPFIECVRHARPDWLVPLDELAAQALQQIGIGQLAGAQQPLPADVVTLARRSIGAPRGYPLFAVRRRAFDVARAAGVPVAAQADANSFDACAAFARTHGYPVVLKQESSRGGVGTFVLDAEAALREFASGEHFGGTRAPWVIQAFVAGALGMHAVFASEGRVLARLSAVQLQRRNERSTSPSSVVRLIRHDAMAAAAAAFVAATGASGFHGWDFQLDDAGRAVLIEHNPRPISISHLGHLLGDDLCRALAGVCSTTGITGTTGMTGATAEPPAIPSGERVVALFPDEWQRDPSSPLLTDAFHDAPWDDRALFAALLQQNVRLI